MALAYQQEASLREGSGRFAQMTEVYEIWLPEKIEKNLMAMACVAKKHEMLTLAYTCSISFGIKTYTLDANGDCPPLEKIKEDWLLSLELLGLIKVYPNEVGGVIFLNTSAHEWLAYQGKGRVGRWFYRWTRAGRATVVFVFGGITVILTIVNLVLAVIQILALLKLI